MKEEMLADQCAFYALWSLAEHSIQSGSLADLLDSKEEIAQSFLYDQTKFQDSYSFRLQRRAFLLSKYIIDDQGKLEADKLDHVINLLEKEGFIFYPKGYCDKESSLHMLFVLKKLRQDKSFYSLFQKFQPPLCHAWAEELVLTSVGSFERKTPTEAQIKRAVISACLTSLRQNVGSCFATAPAILIQQEQIEKLLADLYELLMTGKLKRIFAGIETSVPLSPSSGGGDLYKEVTLTEDLSFSPGLYAAFEATQLVSKETSSLRKKEKIQALIGPIFQKEKSLQVVEVIRKVLLSHFDLKAIDLQRHKEASRAFLKSKEFLGGVKKGTASQKTRACELLLDLEKKAHSAFKACTDHALLKAWEFTLASFSESKMEFSRFNLYSSLGLHVEEKGGIGEVIYQSLQKQLEIDQKKMEQYDVEYQIAYDQVRATESLLKNASNESDARRLQAELLSRVYHMRACLEIRDTLHANASQYSSFLSTLFKEYDAKFPEYFQEIYDADLRDVSSQEYEDGAAGFRLVYKHGRNNAFLWTMVYTPEEYIDFLVDFFLLVEPQIAAQFSWEAAPKILSEITTLVISHIRTPEFLASALERIKKVHGERGELGTPWAYVSGGSMQILLQTYYKRESPITEESKKIESPTDLLIFLLDTLKTLPLAFENKKLLISSPSHAFTLIPTLELFQSGWQDDLFTYTWVRDKVIMPRKRFYEAMTLSSKEQSFLLEEFAKKLPIELSHLLHKVPYFQESSLISFRNAILGLFPRIPLEDMLDSFFYEMTPLISGFEWKSAIRRLLSDLQPTRLEALLESYPEEFSDVISCKKIKEMAKAFYLISQKTFSFSFDLHQAISKKAEELQFAPPSPLFFADTNWAQFYFGFIINPGTGQLELWRIEPSSGVGFPMSSWKKWLSEKNTSPWNICTRPFEYV